MQESLPPINDSSNNVELRNLEHYDPPSSFQVEDSKGNLNDESPLHPKFMDFEGELNYQQTLEEYLRHDSQHERMS